MTTRKHGSVSVDLVAVGPFEANCYLVSDGNDAILIDPGDEAKKIMRMVEQAKALVKKIVLTHGHVDHIGAIAQLRKVLAATVSIHREDARMLTDAMANLSAGLGIEVIAGAADDFLDDGATLELGNASLVVLHTPGHTPGGICLWEPKAKVLFTGDTLFSGSVGRTDFPGSSERFLLASIREKILTLPEDTVIYPGHGPATTVGIEKRTNPWLT